MKAPKYIFIAAALAGCNLAFAQNKKIDTVEFNVISKYKPVITDAVKLNDNPDISDTVRPVRKSEYNNFVYSRFPTSYTPESLDALHMKGEPLDKLYHSYLNAGVGNYTTLYGEYFFNCLRSRNYDYGIHLNHLSSVANVKNYGYGGYAYNDVNLYGELFLHNHTLYAQADFDNHIIHDYGYDVNKDVVSENTTRESYNYLGGTVEYKSFLKDSSSINHDIKLSGYNFSDVFNTAENNLDADAHLYTYYQRQRVDIKVFAHYYNENKGAEKDTNFLSLMFNPYFTEIQKRWDARLGLRVFFDPIATKFYYYPDFIARYRFAGDAALVYAGIDGDKARNSYKNLSDENPFIINTADLRSTYTLYHLFAGLSGTITSNLSYDINGSQSEIDQMPLYVTDTTEALRNRFMVVYDKVKVINGHAELTYIVKENLRFTLGGDYYQYTPTDQAKVWYHPGMKISLTGQYIYHTNFIFKAMFNYIGTQYAPIPPLASQNLGTGVWGVKTINGYPDLNLGFDYKFSKPLTAFISLNNLVNIAYQRWLNYPTQGFNFLAGIRLGF